ncbi:MAG: serine/threonine protein kinase [Verrucomicrobiota bacterium]
MIKRFKLPLWIFPLVIAALVAVFGWWGNGQLRKTIEKELKAQLNATLNANVTALEIWTVNQLKLTTSLTTETSVHDLGLRILEGSGTRSLTFQTDAEQLANYLRPRLKLMGYETAHLVTTNLTVVATSQRNWMAAAQPISEAHTNKFAELFTSGQPVIITPFKPELLLQRRPLKPGPGLQGTLADPRRNVHPLPARSGPGRGRRGDITMMQAAVPIRNAADKICGALALIINPDNEFSKILSVARTGGSGETYAFDQTGLLISHSRFDSQLRQIGLLAATNSSSTLNLRLLDPGGDLTRGYKLGENEEAGRPLIRLVAGALENEKGVEVEPTRDYRGVPVVGAWRWLPQLGFGVATQIDAGEAYRPLHVLQWLFIILTLLLLLFAVGMFVFSYANAISRQRLTEAELKLKQLGQYNLEEKIGEGGMGDVYRARHAMMRRETAVKILLPDRAEPAAIERFEREVCLTCQLTHPNTIQVYDYGHTPDNLFYYAMEFLQGLNLHTLVARFGCVSEGRVIHILTQVCGSLAEAHGLGLIHRDIKPGNIFLCQRGGAPDCVKVLDFGLVREYRSANNVQNEPEEKAAIEGTPWFMPPESILNPAHSDPRSDIYSVGVLGYYLLTGGKFVFEGESLWDIHRRQLEGNPVPPSQRTTNPISHELEQAVLCCLAVDPHQRPQTADELRELLVASPRAAGWKLADQIAWWENFQREPATENDTSNLTTSGASTRRDVQ